MHRPDLLRCLIVLAVAVATFFSPVERAAGGSPVGVNLFEDASAAASRPRVAAAGDDAVRARRRVRVRRELLQTPAAVMAPMRLNLFPGAEFTAVPDRDEQTPDGDRVIAGTLAGVPGSQFLLVVHGEATVADIFVSPLERYQLRREPGEGGTPEIRRLDPGAMPPCGGVPPAPRRLPAATVPRASSPGHPDPAAPRPHAAGEAVDVADDPGTFDVLIAYTPAARIAAGGTAVMEAEARLAVDGANQRYSSSRITPRARLVRTLEVPYVETANGDVFTDFDHLLTDEAGPLADLRAARDAAAADVACLFLAAPPVRPKGSSFFIGAATFAVALGDDGRPFGVPERAFSVVMPAYDVATTFAHEVGHNFGCQHDIENVVFQGVNYGPGIFPYSYGYRFTGNDGRVYHDVMAYDPSQVLPFFSNPQVLYSGVPTGTATADNARTMNETAPLIANLRRLPLVTIRATVPRAVETPTVPGQFTVSRTGPVTQPLTVYLRHYTDDPGSFQTLPDQITIPGGQASVDIPVVPIENDVSQGRRLVALSLLPRDGYRIPALFVDAQATVYLFDTLETVSITAPQPTALRAPLQPGRLQLTRTGPLDEPLTVFLHLDERSAPASYVARKNYRFDPPLTGLDLPPIGAAYVVNYSVEIPAGRDSLDLTLTPDPRALDAFQELEVNVVGRDRYKAGRPSATINILDRPMDLTLPELAITAAEPTASMVTGQNGRFTLTRSRGVETTQTVTVYLSGSADYQLDYSIGGSPYILESASGFQNTIYLYPGESSVNFDIRPMVNAQAPTRTVLATLGIAGNSFYTINPEAADAVVTLLGVPVLSVTATGPEARAVSDLGPVKGEFTLHREGDLSGPLTVAYAVTGSAIAGVQYKALPGVATFPAGEELVRVKVKTRGDAGGPGVKTTVNLTLRPGDGYVLGDTVKAKVKVFGGQ